MDLTEGAINKIEALVLEKQVQEVGGIPFSPMKLVPVIYEPKPDTLVVHNLRGFCGYITNDIDDIGSDKFLIVVDSAESIRLISNIGGLTRQRDIFIQAKLDEKLETFPFGRFLSQEEFAIRFRSLFAQNDGDDFDYVLSYASRLVGGTAIDGDDDGITQTVSVKRGLSGALKDQVALKPIVKLSPYRTFREVKQPESEFLLRVRLDQNDVPTVALFEADGGAWSNTAAENIVDYIQSIVTTIPVIA